MLTLTPTAADVVRELVASAPVDEEAGGIRISVGQATPDGTALQIALVDGPDADDAEVDEAGVHVFLEPVAAELLDDKVLDVEVSGGHPHFAVRDRGGLDASDNGRPDPAA